MEGAAQSLLLFLSAGLVLLHFIKLLSACSGPRKLLRSASKGLQSLCQPQEASPFAKEVQTRLLAMQKDQLRHTAAIMSLVYLYQVAAFLGDGVLGLAVSELATPELVCVIVGYAGVLILLLFPLFIKRSLNLSWLLLFLPVLASRSTLLCPEFRCEGFQVAPHLMAAALLAGRMDGTVAALGGAVWWGLPVVVQKELTQFRSLELLMVGCCCVLAVLTKRRGRQRLLKDVEAEAAVGRQTAFQALLRHFYDVVLELDSELKVLGNAKELAALLLYGSDISLEQRPFLEILRDEDRERVQKRMLNRESSLAETVHAQLRGAHGGSVHVELFVMTFEAAGGSRYVLGLREYNDEAERTSCSADTLMPLEQTQNEVAATVDFSDVRLPVLNASGEFSLIAGGYCSCLQDRLVDGKGFAAWLQGAMKDSLAGCEGRWQCQVRFKALGGLETRALCSATVAEGKDGELAAKLVFSELERTRKKGNASQGSGGSKGSGGSSGRRRKSWAREHMLVAQGVASHLTMAKVRL